MVLELLADLFPEAQLLPVDPLQRAEVRYFLGTSSLLPTPPHVLTPPFSSERFTQLVWSHIPLLIVQSDASVGPKVLEGILEVQRLLARREGTFLLGEQLSLGDIGVASFVGRLIAFGVAGNLSLIKRVGLELIVVSLFPGLLAGGVWETLSTDVAFKPFLAYADVLTSRPAFKVSLCRRSPVRPLIATGNLLRGHHGRDVEEAAARDVQGSVDVELVWYRTQFGTPKPA